MKGGSKPVAMPMCLMLIAYSSQHLVICQTQTPEHPCICVLHRFLRYEPDELKVALEIFMTYIAPVHYNAIRQAPCLLHCLSSGILGTDIAVLDDMHL